MTFRQLLFSGCRDIYLDGNDLNCKGLIDLITPCANQAEEEAFLRHQEIVQKAQEAPKQSKRHQNWCSLQTRLTLLLRCLWKKREVVLELQWFREQRDLCFAPLAINHVRTKVYTPQGYAMHPHKMCHPATDMPPPPPRSAAIAAAKYLGLSGQISSFDVENPARKQ